MIGAFAPAAKGKTDLSDRLFSTKVAEYDAVVQALRGGEPTPPGGQYFDLSLYERDEGRRAKKWGEALSVRAGESRRGDTTIRVPIAMADDGGLCISPIVVDGHDLGDVALACRLVGVRQEDLWVRMQLSKNTFDILARDGSQAGAAATENVRQAGLASIAKDVLSFLQNINNAPPAEKDNMVEDARTMLNFLISMAPVMDMIALGSTSHRANSGFVLSGQDVYVELHPKVTKGAVAAVFGDGPPKSAVARVPSLSHLKGLLSSTASMVMASAGQLQRNDRRYTVF